jgi:hypothetical protein
MIKVHDDQLRRLLPHRELNRKVWDLDNPSSPSLKPEIKDALLKIANEFYLFLNIDAPIDDIIFTGSLANFNYTKLSDIDVHVLIDFSKVDENVDLVRSYMMSKKSIWNDEHNIFVRGFEVEMYPQDENVTGQLRAAGVYSIVTDEWLSMPRILNSKIDLCEVKTKAECIMYKIDDVLRSTARLASIDRLKKKIRDMRLSGLERSGEFSVENLVFKLLRGNGYIGKLYDAAIKDFDDSLSIKQETILREFIYESISDV